MSAIKKSQEQEVSNVVMTEKKIKSTEVCRELTSSNDKDDDAAAATQTHFAKVTGALKEVTHFSQSQASL